MTWDSGKPCLRSSSSSSGSPFGSDRRHWGHLTWFGDHAPYPSPASDWHLIWGSAPNQMNQSDNNFPALGSPMRTKGKQAHFSHPCLRFQCSHSGRAFCRTDLAPQSSSLRFRGLSSQERRSWSLIWARYFLHWFQLSRFRKPSRPWR